MLTIYRPYVSSIKTAYCLSGDDKSKMKLNCSIIVKVIAELSGWKPETILSRTYRNDPFVLMYYNGGAPFMDALMTYYYSVYVYGLKSCGEKMDFLTGYEALCRKNSDKCEASDFWNKEHAFAHRIYLLHYDRQWYKRHFRRYRNHRCSDKKLLMLVENGRPVVIDKKTMKKDVV